jgi:nitrogen fixation protein FixH
MIAAERPFTGRHMLVIMLAFFAVVLGANLSLVYFANHSWTGLVVKNSYVASQQFNETTEKLARAEAGLHVTPAYQAGVLTLTLIDDGQRPFPASHVSVVIGRPSHEGEDRVLELARQSDGVFAVETELGKGLWQGMLTARRPGYDSGHGDWQRPIRLLVRSEP